MEGLEGIQPEKKEYVKLFKGMTKNDLVRMLAMIATIQPVAPTPEKKDEKIDPIQAFIGGEYHIINHIHDIMRIWLEKDQPKAKPKKS